MTMYYTEMNRELLERLEDESEVRWICGDKWKPTYWTGGKDDGWLMINCYGGGEGLSRGLKGDDMEHHSMGSVRLDNDAFVEECKKRWPNKEGKVCKINAEDFVKEVVSKAKGEIDVGALKERLVTSVTKMKLRNAEKDARKEGLRYVTENSDRISLYQVKMLGSSFGLGVGVEQLDEEGRIFRATTCICAPRDYRNKGWSDRVARWLLGIRLKRDQVCNKYSLLSKTDMKTIAQIEQTLFFNNVLNGGDCPIFLKKICENNPSDIVSVGFRGINIGKRGK